MATASSDTVLAGHTRPDGMTVSWGSIRATTSPRRPGPDIRERHTPPAAVIASGDATVRLWERSAARCRRLRVAQTLRGLAA